MFLFVVFVGSAFRPGLHPSSCTGIGKFGWGWLLTRDGTAIGGMFSAGAFVLGEGILVNCSQELSISADVKPEVYGMLGIDSDGRAVLSLGRGPGDG